MKKLLSNEYRTAAALRAAYYPGHEYCALCGIPVCKSHRPLELAHIFRGPNRRHVVENVVMLCYRCHGHQHEGGYREPRMGPLLPPITPALLIACKLALDELDTAVLATVTGWAEGYIRDLANCKMPEVYAREWAKWG